MPSMEMYRWITSGAALAVLWSLETIIPTAINRRYRLKHAARNVAWGFFNAVVIRFAFAAAVAYVTVKADEHHVGLLHMTWFAERPWLQWTLAIVLFDVWQYAWHRVNHRVPLFWRFHSVHHTDAEMDVSTAVRFHTGEIIYSSVVRLAVLPLLGLSVDQLLLYESILLPVILFHHSNVRIPKGLDRALRVLIVTPWMHWVHHSDWQPETDSNYSSIFSIWDRLFGSYRFRDEQREIRLGLADVSTERWNTMRGMLVTPFAGLRDEATPPDSDADQR